MYKKHGNILQYFIFMPLFETQKAISLCLDRSSFYSTRQKNSLAFVLRLQNYVTGLLVTVTWPASM